MFSWSKKKESKRRGRRDQESEENEFGIKMDKGPDDKELEAELKGLTGVDSFPEDEFSLNEGEEDVESELLRLMGGGKGKRQTKKPTNSDESVGDISQLTANIDLGDEDVEVDENDEELLAELLELTNPDDADTEEQEVESDSRAECEDHSSNGDSDILKTLKERLNLYKTAEGKAKENNESSRARRFARGIKTLEDLLKKAKAGKAVSPSDIPPVIALNLKPAPPPTEIPANENGASEESEDLPQNLNSDSHAPEPDAPSEPPDVMKILRERLQLYQTAEAKAKENGETTRARRFSRGIKTLEGLIKQVQAGKEIVPEDIPPVVPLNLKPAPPVPVVPPSEDYEEQVENKTGNVTLVSPQEPSEEPESKDSQEEERSMQDILLERLQMYKTAEAKARESGETSRARRFDRGIKTLQDLIKKAAAGKNINPDDIPPVIAMNLKPAPPITVIEEVKPQEPSIERENLVKSSDIPSVPLSFTAVDDVDVDKELGEVEEEEEEEEETPTTVLEGLEQRVRFYSKFQEKARQEGNSALADQNERIIRVYVNAINTFKKGGYVDVENLPNPRGCPPIPIPFYIP